MICASRRGITVVVMIGIVVLAAGVSGCGNSNACACSPPVAVIETDKGAPPLTLNPQWHAAVGANLTEPWTPVAAFGTFGAMKSLTLRMVGSELGIPHACFASANQLGTTTVQIAASGVSRDGVILIDSPGTGYADAAVDLALQQVTALLSASGGVVIAVFKDRIYESARNFMEHVTKSIATHRLSGGAGVKPALIAVLRTAVPNLSEEAKAAALHSITSNEVVASTFGSITPVIVPEVDGKEAAQWCNCDTFDWNHGAEALRPMADTIIAVIRGQTELRRRTAGALQSGDTVAALEAAAPAIAAGSQVPMPTIRAMFERNRATAAAAAAEARLRRRWPGAGTDGATTYAALRGHYTEFTEASAAEEVTFNRSLESSGIAVTAEHTETFRKSVRAVDAAVRGDMAAASLRSVTKVSLQAADDWSASSPFNQLTGRAASAFEAQVYPWICDAAHLNPSEDFMGAVRSAWQAVDRRREALHNKERHRLRETKGSQLERIELLGSAIVNHGNVVVTGAFDLRPYISARDTILSVEAEVVSCNGEAWYTNRGAFTLTGGRQFIIDSNTGSGGEKGIATRHWFEPSSMTFVCHVQRWGWGDCCPGHRVSVDRVTLFVQHSALKDAPEVLRSAYVPQPFPESAVQGVIARCAESHRPELGGGATSARGSSLRP